MEPYTAVSNIFPSAMRRHAYVLFGLAGVSLVALALEAPWVIAIFVALLVVILSALEYEPFILLLVFLFPLNMILVGSSLVNDIGAALRALVVVGFFLGRIGRGQIDAETLWRSAVTRAFIAFLGVIVLSAIFGSSGETHASIRGVYFISTYIGIYLMAFVWLDTPARLQKVFLVVLASTFVVCMFAFYQWLADDYTSFYFLLYPRDNVDPWNHRPPSVLGQPLHLAGYLTLALALAFACIKLSDNKRLKVFSWLVLISGSGAVALTLSRGAYLACLAITCLAIWMFAKGWKTRLSLLAGILSVTFVAAHFVAEVGPTRLKLEESGSVMIRFILWGVAWKLFLSSPVFGIGFGTFQLIYSRYLPTIADMPTTLGVHNIYLELLAETGVIGLLVFLLLMYAILREAHRRVSSHLWQHRVLGFTVFAGGTGLLVESFTDHAFFWSIQVGSLFWFFVGLLLASSRESEEQQGLRGV
jgi:putative inorganic carbon (HCO3(-)) transporter